MKLKKNSKRLFHKKIKVQTDFNENLKKREVQDYYKIRTPKILKMIDILHLDYKIKNVSNMLLKKVIEHLQNAVGVDLTDEGEICKYISFISKVVPDFIKVLDTSNGVFIRINTIMSSQSINDQIVKFFEQKEENYYCSEIGTIETKSEDIVFMQ